jgi:hypothetical protein
LKAVRERSAIKPRETARKIGFIKNTCEPTEGGLGWGEEPVKVYANPLPEGEGTTGGNPYQFLICSGIGTSPQPGRNRQFKFRTFL